MIDLERGGLRLLAFSNLPWPGFRCAVSTTPLDVREESGRAAFAEALGLDPARVVSPTQVHHARVVRVDGETPGRGVQADGLVTDVPGLPLLLRAADCSLIVVADPEKRAVGVAHAGWKGSARGVVVNLVKALVEHYGSDPADCRAGIGPTIRPGRYPVGPEVPAAFLASRRWAKEYVLQRDGQLRLDLAGVNWRFLVESGLKEEAIEDCELCTFDSPGLLHSFRRDGVGAGHHGLLAAWVSSP